MKSIFFFFLLTIYNVIVYLHLDRVVDELNPESNFTWKDVTTLIQDDEDDGPVQELSKFASSYTDKVLKYLVSEMSPSLSKVSILLKKNLILVCVIKELKVHTFSHFI